MKIEKCKTLTLNGGYCAFTLMKHDGSDCIMLRERDRLSTLLHYHSA